MMQRLRTQNLFFGFVVLVGFSCSDSDVRRNYANYSRVHSASGISGRPYQEIVSELRELEGKYSDVARVINYGQTVQGRELTMIRIAKPGNFAKRKGVFISGTIHGDEFLNIEDRLPRWFLENQHSPGVAKYLDSGGIIWIAPILNPDGYTAQRRENNKGKDLNRDFELKVANKAGYTQPEIIGLNKIINSELAEQNATLGFTMDYHCCVGAIIFPWGYSETKELPPAEKQKHLRYGKIILDQFPKYGIGRAIDIVNYTALGASDDHWHEAYNATAFTFEGAQYQEKKNFNLHTKMWDNLLAAQAAETEGQIGTDVADTRPKLSVLESLASGVVVASSGPIGTKTIAICKGNVPSCGLSQSLVSFAAAYQSGDRQIFKARGPISVQTNEVFTIQAFDSASSPTGRSTIRFRSR